MYNMFLNLWNHKFPQ